MSSKKIAGRVTSAEDGSPLSGVNVLLKGTNQGTVTDAQGNFQMSAPRQNPELLMSSIGLETKEVSAGNQGPLAVKMKSDTRQLSELAVSGSSAVSGEAPDDAKIFEFAMPAGGRSAFQKYLETSVHYPVQALDNKIEGRVTVQFSVTPEGSLTNFTVLKGIGSGCDEELIRLIQNGPAWSPSRRNQVPIEDKVRVRLRFSLPK
jgi:TonB family protein